MGEILNDNPAAVETNNQAMFKKAMDSTLQSLRDVNKIINPTVRAINKDKVKRWIQNVGGNEKNLRNTSRYLYYRSNIYFRLINWYASMFCLDCRKITPNYDLTKEATDSTAKEILRSYQNTLNCLDVLNLQGNMLEALITVFREDVYYGLLLQDDMGSFFYQLDPDECVIDGKYFYGCYGFSIDMSKWKTSQKQTLMEMIGEPLVSMYKEYENSLPGKIQCMFQIQNRHV